MIITEITEENRTEYKEMVSDEVLSDLSRNCLKGLSGREEGSGGVRAVIIWMVKDHEDEHARAEAEILCFWTFDEAVGEELFHAFEKHIIADKVSRISFEFDELGTRERDLLANSGFEIKEAESRDICVSVGELSGLKLGRKKIPPYVKSISEISVMQFKTAIMASVFCGRYGILDDLPYLPMARYDQSISCCVITDDRVNGLLLVHKEEDGGFIVELLFAVQPDADINLLNMMKFSIDTAVRLCDREERVILRRHNKLTEALVKKLFPDKKGAVVIRGQKNDKQAG